LHKALGWDTMMDRWKKFDPNISIYRGGGSIFRQINRSRLLIVSYNSTTHLEALSANFPTIFFWETGMTELRVSAQYDYDLMHEVGIFHRPPESAAKKINQIYQDPLSWWYSPEIQKARESFCRRYAWTTKTWRSDWKNFF